MHFYYVGRDRQGKTVKGKIEGNSSTDVSAELLSRNVFPTEIRAATEQSNDIDFSNIPILSTLLAPKFEKDDLVLFARQLYSLVHAGVPLTQSIQNLEHSYDDKPVLQTTLKEVTNDLELGRPLGLTLARFPHVFPSLFVNIVKVGEQTGELDKALMQLSNYLEQDLENRRQIKQAMRYPFFVIIAMCIAIAVINAMIIPAFSGIFQKMGADLPLQTKILVAMSEFTSAYWPFMLGISVFGFFGYKHWVTTPVGRLWNDTISLRLPLVGSLNRKGTLCRFCRSLGLALESGVPLLQALHVVSGSLDNQLLEKQIHSMQERIENGETMLRASKGSNLFTPLILQMIAVGEQTGKLDAMLIEAADHYDGEVKHELKNLSTNIEPILIIMMGGMVTVLALGVFLPVWELSARA